MSFYHDLSSSVSESMLTWPGDPTFRRRVSRGESGAQTTEFTMGTHTGTHIDAPKHVLGRSHIGIDAVPLDILLGPATLVDLSSRCSPVTAERLCRHLPRGAPRRLLLRLRPGPLAADHWQDFPALHQSAANWLVHENVRLLGVDVPSVDSPEATDLAVHRILLAGNLVIVENLVLDDIEPGEWQLACLPLKLADADGAPARAVLWR